MNFLSNRHRKYLILLPIIFLLLNAVFFSHAIKEIDKTLFEGKYVDTINFVDMLAAGVEATSDREWQDHGENIRDAVEFMDKQHQVYAGAYKMIDGQLVTITNRYSETSIFEPTDYAEFTDAITTQDFGRLVIGYTPEDQDYRELHLYFRWMPLHRPMEKQYLVVAGVSHLSVAIEIAQWVSMGQFVSMAVTFILNVWLIVLLTRLGHVYGQRKGDKWHDGRR